MKTTVLTIIAIALFLIPNAGTLQAAWFDSNFGYCRELTIASDASGSATTTTNGYTILATTTLSTLAATSSAGKVEKLDSSNNLPFDVIFTSGTECNDDGGSLLDYEIESYASTTGEIVAWVEVTDISSSADKNFLMYYGYDAATDQSDAVGTWNSTYAGVWHLPEDPSGTAPQMLDSTSNNNDGTSGGTMTTSDQVAGQIDGSLDFDGTNDFVSATDSASLDISSSWTNSAWFNISVAPGNFKASNILDKQLGTSESAGFNLNYSIALLDDISDCTDDICPLTAFEDSSGNNYSAVWNTALSLNTWYFITGVFDDSANTLTLYMDGVQRAQTTGVTAVPDQNGQAVEIGDNSENISGIGEFFDGLIDEARVLNVALHTDDITTEYNYGVDNTSFLTWGAEETETPAPVPAGPVGKARTLRFGTMILLFGTLIIY